MRIRPIICSFQTPFLRLSGVVSLAVFLGLSTARPANVIEEPSFRVMSALPATSCVDPGLHFTVREFRGTILDVKGSPMPSVNGTLFRYRKGKTEEGRPTLEAAPEVFTTFVSDAEGRFRVPKMRYGLYRVYLDAPRGYIALPVNVKVDGHGVSDELIATLGILGTCQAWWKFAQVDNS